MRAIGELASAAMAAGAVELADRLRAAGLAVVVQGTMLLVSGPGLRSREFGSAPRAPRPIVGPVVEGFAGLLVAAVASAVGEGRDG